MADLLSELQRNVTLAPFTTLKLGGPAEYFFAVSEEEKLLAALQWAHAQKLPVTVLAGGSNVVIADEGIRGLVVHLKLSGSLLERDGRVVASAGENWDLLVQRSGAAGLSGLECMSGVPGSVGATPIQNVGAYGQQVSDTLQWVRVWDRTQSTEQKLSAQQCDFAYRSSRFKQEPNRFIVLQAAYQLAPGALPEIKYKELEQELASTTPSIESIRNAVLKLRRKKSMVVDSQDPHSQSVGSFFLNPIVSAEQADALVDHAIKEQWLSDPQRAPVQHTHDGRIKIPAAWLIEHSGIERGYRQGAVGVSPNHALALVHYGGGSTQQLLELASFVRNRVRDECGIALQMEPVLLGAIQLL